MKNKRMRLLNSLPNEDKDIICDACEENNSCECCYSHFFKKKQCHDVANRIIDEFDIIERELKRKDN